MTTQTPLASIPKPDVIQDRLAQIASERALLRALLKLSLRCRRESADLQRSGQQLHPPGGPTHAP